LSKRQKKRKDPASYRKRSYRALADGHGLRAFEVRMRETDLHIMASRALPEAAMDAVLAARAQIENHIVRRPQFMRALAPLPGEAGITPLLATMYEAAARAGVGPMAAVAGAISEFVGKELLQFTNEIILENGGDIFLKVTRPVKIGIYAGDSQFTGKLAIKIEPKDTPLGICTSSGTVGHSLSFGKSDIVSVISSSTALADAAATSIANRIKEIDDLKKIELWASQIEGVRGVLAILNGNISLWGDVEITTV